MFRHKFLGSTDISTECQLLKTYDVQTKIPRCIKQHEIKQQNDLMLIDLGTLLTPVECNQIIKKIKTKQFERMTDKYDSGRRNNARLVVMDAQLSRTLWRRLKISHRLDRLVKDTKPLGFNVQGEWKMSGVNPAMRINRYTGEHFFAPHKDAQYAPSGDERSLFSLIIYLNDDYTEGETKFYFPKIQPNSDVKGLTIKEEIQAYGGLETGYECVTIKPKKGHAVLFTHNLLHEAISPKTNDSNERIVLRSDVLVQRTGKPLGFAVSTEEEADYLACLNFFRQAQQDELDAYGQQDDLLATGELYERSLSIRYCYPRLLEDKLQQSMDIDTEQKSVIDQLPPETWLHIFQFLNERDVENFVFAYPQFQLMQMAWHVQEKNSLNNDRRKEKFIPNIECQYGCHTLFHFSDVQFFNQHIQQCCRVAAVYAFFLLGNARHATTYIVRYNRTTHEVCEVDLEKLLFDVFYNRNCYGSLYRVDQKDENKRQPEVDLDHSVDRTYMTNRHQSQFIGQDLLPRFHFTMGADSDDTDDDEYAYNTPVDSNIRRDQRTHILYDRQTQFIDEDRPRYREPMREFVTNDKVAFQTQIIEQSKQESGSSICRILSGEDQTIGAYCSCFGHVNYHNVDYQDLIETYNHLVFDFDTHQLTVEHVSDEKNKLCPLWLHSHVPKKLRKTVSEDKLQRHYRVNIEKLAQTVQGFNHASCNCRTLDLKADQFTFQDYTYLKYVDLIISDEPTGVLVLAKYAGIVAM